MWHQGLLLTSTFPSFALTAFVSALEVLATSDHFARQLGPPPVACTACGNVPQVTARFWNMVSLLADEPEHRRLRQEWRVYDRRSSTVHRGATFGVESSFGRTFLFDYLPGPPTTVAIDEQDAAQVFVLRVLPNVSGLASRALVEALRAPPDGEASRP